LIKVATAGSDKKCAACLKLCADRAIDYRTQDFDEVMKEEKLEANVILDMVGGDYIGRNLMVAAMHGRIVQIAFQKSSKVEIDLLPVMVRHLTFTGSTLRPRSVVEKADIARELEAKVWPLLAEGKCKPVIHARFPLAEAAKAHALVESSAHVGKIILIS
jgi:NADPH2:quinone reductase